jgi:hypothetical protein
VVLAALDKVRPNLPVKPLPKKEPSDDNILKAGAKGAKVAKVKPVMKSNVCGLTIQFVNQTLYKFE